MRLHSIRQSFIFKAVSFIQIAAFIFSTFALPVKAYAQSAFVATLPQPGAMVAQSASFVPVMLKGMTLYPDNPLRFDFIVDSGNSKFSSDQIKAESNRLVKYFLAAMTVPQNDLWVNLSPYEADRIIPEALGKTELGQDMLAQDYILKQLSSSLLDPEKDLGKEFWARVYKQTQEKFGVAEVPVNTFNKVWIMPEEATVYEHGTAVYVVKSRLKVMLDQDYKSLQMNMEGAEAASEKTSDVAVNDTASLSAQITREIILPEIAREVNEGKNFAAIRQIYQTLILAKWYKETIKESLLSKVYIDQKKIKGIDLADPTIKDQIYSRYVDAFKKGVVNLIKEDYDAVSQQTVPRKYFSGGEIFGEIPLKRDGNAASVNSSVVGDDYKLSLRIEPAKGTTDFVKASDKAQSASYKQLVADQKALREFSGDPQAFKDLQTKIEQNQRELQVLEDNLKLVLAETFTADVRQRIINFKKSAMDEPSATKVADDLMRGNSMLAKALAIEIERRLASRDGLILFMRPVLDPVAKETYKDNIDRYNRIVEGVAQLLTSGDYGSEAIFVNSWAFSPEEFKLTRQKGTHQFTQLFFGQFLAEAQKRVLALDLATIKDSELKAVLEKIRNVSDIAGLSDEYLVEGYIKPLIDHKGLNVLGDLQEKFFLYSAPPGAGKGTIMKVTFQGENDKGGKYVPAPYESIVKKYVLIHSRSARVHDQEVNGVSYHFWSKEKIAELEKEKPSKIKVVLVNGSPQAIVLRTFEDRITIDLTNPTEKVLPEIDKDVAYSADGKKATVTRTYKGILDVFEEDSLYFVEGGYAWMQFLKGEYPRISLGFIAPFSEQEMKNRSEMEDWLEATYGQDAEKIRKAYEVLGEMIKEGQTIEAAITPYIHSDVKNAPQEIHPNTGTVPNYRKEIQNIVEQVSGKIKNADVDLGTYKLYGFIRGEEISVLSADLTFRREGSRILCKIDNHWHDDEFRHVRNWIETKEVSFRLPISLESPLTDAIKAEIISEVADRAERVGGINMKEVNVNHQGSGMDIKFDPAVMQNILTNGVDGFVPVIIDLVPIQSPLMVMGVGASKPVAAARLSKLEGPAVGLSVIKELEFAEV